MVASARMKTASEAGLSRLFPMGIQSRLDSHNLGTLWKLGDWDCVVTVNSIPVLHHSVDFIF